MEVIFSASDPAPTRSSSTLNPNAPLFVPMDFRAVEDFSDQWWDLVHSSPWFRDYWLRERFQDPQIDPPSAHSDDPDQHAFLHDLFQFQLHPREFFSHSSVILPLLTLFIILLKKKNCAENVVVEEEEEGGGDYEREVVSMGALKWRRGSGRAEAPRYAQKAPKIVKARVSPRTIQQPR